ncbi:MAG: multiprotein-bridging factor 1 family protein, partial [Ilumatobacteraceae bacterium]
MIEAGLRSIEVDDAASFGVLLRRARLAAVLTQERLAERARISAAGIAALESGRRRAPRATTVALLLDALDLDGAARTQLIAAAAGERDRSERPAGAERAVASPRVDDPGR